MRIPESLVTLADEGIIQEVCRPLMSGKEAQIYLVVSERRECAAKVYKDFKNRSFKNRADYVEGRKVRNVRDQRAMNKGSKYGRSRDEDSWRSTEVDVIYRLRAAGVRVPEPYTFIDGVLLMELVTGAEGTPAPRLGDLRFSEEQAVRIYHRLIQEVARMLCAGIVHGDLSEFNVLLAADGPVIIDFPQAVSAAENQNARSLLIRDVNNLHRFLARWAPRVRRSQYAEEMWSLYERNRLTPDTRLTGQFRSSSGPVNTRAVLGLIQDAERDQARRRPGSPAPRRSEEESTTPAAAGTPHPPRRREVIVVEPRQPRGGQQRTLGGPASAAGRGQGRPQGQAGGRSAGHGQGRTPGQSPNPGQGRGRAHAQGPGAARSSLGAGGNGRAATNGGGRGIGAPAGADDRRKKGPGQGHRRRRSRYS